MLRFRDLTFCSAKCQTLTCLRNYTPQQKAAAHKWWGGEDAPVAMSDFSVDCKDYKPYEN